MWDHCWNTRWTNQKSLRQIPWLGSGQVVRGWDKGISFGGGQGCWSGTRIGCGHHVGGLGALVGVAEGTWQSCWEGRDAGGLQLLATTMSSSMSSSSSVRIWKGLLCHVRRWCTIGNLYIVHGVVMVFYVVATLGGVAIATLGDGSISTLGDVGMGGGKLIWPDIIAESWQIAERCLSLVLAIVGIVCPSCLNKSAAASKVLSCSDATGTWQWAGYSHHKFAKRKQQVDGM